MSRTAFIRTQVLLLGWLSSALPCLPAFAFTEPPGLSGTELGSGKAVTVDLAHAERGTVLVFLSARCPCSASHEVRLRELASEFGPKGFHFVGIHSNADEPVDFSEAHFKETQLPFPVIQDDGAKLADELGALKTPHVFVFGPKHELLFQGGVDDSHSAALAKKPYLREALTAISEGKQPPQKEVRSLGCIIQRP